MSGISIEEFMKLNQELIEVKGKVYEKQERLDKATRELNKLKGQLSTSEGSFEATTSQLQMLKSELRNADARVKAAEDASKNELAKYKKSALMSEDEVKRLRAELTRVTQKSSPGTTTLNQDSEAESISTPSKAYSPSVSANANAYELEKSKKDLIQRDEDLARVLALYSAEQQRATQLQSELEAVRKSTSTATPMSPSSSNSASTPRVPKPPAGAPPVPTAAQAQAHREQLSTLRRELEKAKSSLSEEKEQSRVASRRLRVLAASVVSLRAELARSKESTATAEGRSLDAVTIAEKVLTDRELAHDNALRAARVESERVATALRARVSALEEITTRSSDAGARLMEENRALLVRACTAEAAQENLEGHLASIEARALEREDNLRDEALMARAHGTQRGLSAAELRKQLRREVSQAQRLALQLRVCVDTHPDLVSVIDPGSLAAAGSGSGSTSNAASPGGENDGFTTGTLGLGKSPLSPSVGEIAMVKEMEALRARVAYLESSNSLLQSDLEEKKALAKSLMSDIALGNVPSVTYDGTMSANSAGAASPSGPASEGAGKSRGDPATPSKVSRRKMLLSYMGVNATPSAGGGSNRGDVPSAEVEARSAHALLLESAVRTERMKSDMSRLGEEVDSLMRQVKNLTAERDQLQQKLLSNQAQQSVSSPEPEKSEKKR